MTRIPIHFSTANDLVDFVNLVSRYDCRVLLKSDDNILDAKSLVGAIVLSRSPDLEMLVDPTDCQDLLEHVAVYA